MYHQIKSIPIDVCSAEQKLACNMMEKSYNLFKNRWNSAKDSVAKTRIAADIVSFAVDIVESSRSKAKEKYDMTEVIKIMYVSIFDYMNHPKTIDPKDYNEIGKIFKKIEV